MRILNKFKESKYLIPFIFFLFIAIVCEVFIFNFRSLETTFCDGISSIDVIYCGGVRTGNGRNKVSVNHKNNVIIEIKDIDKQVKNLKIDAEIEESSVLTAIVSAKDDGNSNYYTFRGREIVKDIEASKYMRLNLAGKAEEIKIELKDTANKPVTINYVGLNERVPMSFSWSRLIFVCLTLYAFYLLRAKSHIYTLKPNRVQERAILFIFVLINILLLWWLVRVNPTFVGTPWSHHRQYHRLAEALAQGQFHLNDEPSSALMSMENPYDYNARKKAGVAFLWDHAYFDGKYYVYFGVVPCVLFYLPYYLITGTHLETYIAIFITSSLTVIGITLLLREIIKKHYKDTPFAVFLILCQLIISGGGIWLLTKRPDFYSLPITTAIMLSIFGIYFWIKSVKDDKLSGTMLFLGSLFMALVAGSRPQFLLGSFFSLIIFAKSFKERTFVSKKSIGKTVAFVIPYVLVAMCLMYYNFARFGSPFDFGANYNLTLNDMTLRGIRADRTFLGWFYYLFQPPQLTAVFPFIATSRIETAYMGTTIWEGMYGGILATNPYLWLGFGSIFLKKYFKDMRCYIATILCTLSCIIISFADTQMAGILPRYFGDFAMFLHFGTAITFLAVYSNLKTECETITLKRALLNRPPKVRPKI